MLEILNNIFGIPTAKAALLLKPQGSVQIGTVNKDIVNNTIITAFFGNDGTNGSPKSTGLLEWLLIIIASAAIFYIIWSGIQYISSGGNAEAQKTAKSNLINAFIGVIVVVLVYTIIQFGVIIGNTISNLL